ncbi:MAG TPA: oligopeptide transporter, OPT family, partial [Gemmatimonadales bacterium]|nr:oligopeptide transporter, OPT family [Gemmatimonadales bacterium]
MTQPFKPYVPANTDMPEFTLRAVLIGLVMCVILGAANAYLGLKAGMTIAATYPAAVIGMAVLRTMRGSILEENVARTVGSIGESVAAGAIFTLPAFYIAGIWTDFASTGHYIQSTLIMIAGGVLGIMFVALLRRVLVEDKELPFPESVAASEIHKAGRGGGTGAKFLFGAMGVGAVIQGLAQINLFTSSWQKFVAFARTSIGLRSSGSATGQSGMLLSSPSISPAFIGVGYIIGPKLASLNFAGGVVAWGLMVPILTYFIAPTVFTAGGPAPTTDQWISLANNVWFTIVRPIAIGGMLMSAAYTLFRMRKSLIAGIQRSIGDVKKAASGAPVG